jgi:hypothetical protein
MGLEWPHEDTECAQNGHIGMENDGYFQALLRFLRRTIQGTPPQKYNFGDFVVFPRSQDLPPSPYSAAGTACEGPGGFRGLGSASVLSVREIQPSLVTQTNVLCGQRTQKR